MKEYVIECMFFLNDSTLDTCIGLLIWINLLQIFLGFIRLLFGNSKQQERETLVADVMNELRTMGVSVPKSQKIKEEKMKQEIYLIMNRLL